MLTDETLMKLEQKQEELALLFLSQTTAEEWKDLSTAQLRGDVYWYKKNAAQTIGLIVRIQTLLNLRARGPGPVGITPPPPEEEQERMIAKAEQDANEMIERVRKHTAKR